jgi:hypothetical protein
MEADWEFEVGGNAPVIEPFWSGFVDLRRMPERANDLAETAQLPSLAAALKRLNTEPSPIWTSKCDYWPELQPGEFDSDELDAPPGSSGHAAGCYIDLLAKEDREWSLPPSAEATCKRLCTLLGAVSLRCCRVDLIIRRALNASSLAGLGITAYITACGPSADEAKNTLEAALAAFAHAFCCQSKLQ